MHLIDASRSIKIQVIRLYNENLSAKEISRYLIVNQGHLKKIK